jgi:hypothetical protein
MLYRPHTLIGIANADVPIIHLDGQRLARIHIGGYFDEFWPLERVHVADLVGSLMSLAPGLSLGAWVICGSLRSSLDFVLSSVTSQTMPATAALNRPSITFAGIFWSVSV